MERKIDTLRLGEMVLQDLIEDYVIDYNKNLMMFTLIQKMIIIELFRREEKEFETYKDGEEYILKNYPEYFIWF